MHTENKEMERQMKAIRLKNFRGFADTDFVPLKPLTLLVGRNNSGKSSFLRALPLLRQSVERPTKGPILWFGQYVDFGSFKDTVCADADTREISISFNFESNILSKSNRDDYFFTHLWHLMWRSNPPSVEVELVLAEDKDTAITRICTLKFAEQKISLHFKKKEVLAKFYVNGLNVLDLGEKYTVHGGAGLLPRLVAENRTHEYYTPFPQSEKLLQDIVNRLDSYFHGRTSPHTRMQIVSELGMGSDEVMLENIRTAQKNQTWQQRTSTLTTQDDIFRHVRNLVIANAIPLLLYILNEYLNTSLENVRYIAPIRATTERYYRPQELGVNEVDPRGSNLAMFLQSLSSDEMDHFRSWIKRFLGFSVRVESVGGHTSLQIKEAGSKKEYNIADLGFGFSQILPVATQLWATIYRRKNSQSVRSPLRMLAIEQPELHMHPAFQSRLADLLLDLIVEAQKHNIDIRLLVETHSETIINRIGSRIANDTPPTHPKADTPDDQYAASLFSDIQIVLFQSDENKGTNVSLSTYDEQGFLTNWPYGFFEPEI